MRDKVLPHVPLAQLAMHGRPVAETPQQDAEQTAVNLVALASEIAVNDPPAYGIAQPTDVILISANDHPAPLQWAAIE